MNTPAIKSGYAFSRNPIIIQHPSDSTFGINPGKFRIKYGWEYIFEGRFTRPLSIDISDIVDAYSNYFDEVPEDNTEPIRQIEERDDLGERTIICNFEDDYYDGEYSCIVIPGGISQQNYRRFLNLGRDVFQERFINPNCNFFLTTRTASWRIVLKETELYPLYFIVPDITDSVKILAGTESYDWSCDDLGIAALDIASLRKYFIENKNILPSVFDIYYNEKFSCRIVIEKSENVRERYRLKFRNSLGVYEIIELIGELSISPEYTDSEEAKFKRYDKITAGFNVDRERVDCRQIITVDTGVKRSDEIRFLMDMLGSDEVYLLDLTSLPIKVIPSVEDMTFNPQSEKPQNFTIKLEIPFSEENMLPDIVDGSDSVKPRVHSYQFTKTFN